MKTFKAFSPQLQGIFYVVLAAIAFLLIGAGVRNNEYFLQVLNITLMNVTVVTAYSMLLGYCGQLSLATGAFLGTGAYTSSLLMLKAGVPFWPSAAAALLIAGGLGACLGVVSFRVRGHYLAVVTLAFNVLLVQVLIMWSTLTRGPLGLVGVPRPSLGALSFETRWSFFVLLTVLFAVVGSVVVFLVKGVLGWRMLAVKSDEVAAACSGINPRMAKIIAFSLSSGLAGLVGAFQASYVQVIQPDAYGFMKSIEVVLMSAVGGPGNIAGPALSAFGLSVLPEVLRTFGEWEQLLMGLVVAAVIIVFPAGIGGLLRLLGSHRKMSGKEISR